MVARLTPVAGLEPATLNDLERVTGTGFLGFHDVGALAQRTTAELYRLLALPLVSVAVCDGPSQFAMRGVHGARNDRFGQVQLSSGEGMGGRVMIERRPVQVRNYPEDPHISSHFVDVVRSEGLGGMVAVPVEFEGDLIAILYGGVRSVGSIGDRATSGLQTAAANLAPQMAAAIRTSTAVQQSVQAERQRIAGELHDDVGQLLFSISVAAKRLRDESGEQQAEVARRIEIQAQEATQRMREAFRVMAPGSHEALASALQREADDLQGRSNLTTYFVVVGNVRQLAPAAEAALIGSTRQALFNVEQHAKAALVVMTLHFDENSASLVIQDDGCGLPEDLEPEVIPRGEHHWGFASILRKVQQQGGDVAIRAGEDGGTTIRITVPYSSPS